MTDEQKKDEGKPAALKPEGEAKPTAPAEGQAAAPAMPPKPAPPAAKPPAKPKPPGPEPIDNELLHRLRARFSGAVGEAVSDRGQAIVTVSAERLLEVCRYLKEEEKFDFLTDLTALDWYERRPRFDVVLNLYSFAHNQRLRLKVPVDDACASVTGLWGAADWLERECFDMFGLVFTGHPHLKRILLPDDWKGYPLRKDYDILRQDAEWVKENLGIESGQ